MKVKIGNSINVFVIVFFVLMQFSILAFAGNDNNEQITNSKNAGEQAAKQFQSSYGSKSGVKSRVISPLMSNTQMSTLNGKTKFTAQIECPSSKAFLQILFQPSSTQDFKAVISQDPNMTGHFTYQIITPYISGVCSNGFISCTQGTWDNCHFYQWSLNNGTINWVERLTPSDLGTCFCINTHCGGNVFNQFYQISNTFGAGLAAFIAQATHFAISNVKAVFPTLTYYGQDAKDCTTVSGTSFSGTPYNNPSQYYKNSSALTNAESNAVTDQSSNKDSPYYSALHSEYVRNNVITTKQCEIDRRVNYSSQSKWVTDGGSDWSSQCQGIDKIANNLYECWLVPNSPDLLNGCGSGYKYNVNGHFYFYAYSPDDFTGAVKIGGSTVWSLSMGKTGGTTPYTYENKLSTNGEQQVEAYVYNAGACNGQPTAKFAIFLKREEGMQEVKTDTCKNLNVGGCKLENEQVCDYNGQNCVYTIRNYEHTDIDLLKNCTTITDSQSGVQWDVCTDGSTLTYVTNSGGAPSGTLETGNNVWWTVKKEYTCQQDNVTMPSLSREEEIEKNGTYDPGTGIVNYPDTTTESNGLGGYSGNYNAYVMKGDYTNDNCTQTCIVVDNPPRTYAIGNGAETTNAPPSTPTDITKREKYLTCKQNSEGNWYCPALDNETIAHGCTCLDQGTSTIAVMQALVQAAKDLTCSTK